MLGLHGARVNLRDDGRCAFHCNHIRSRYDCENLELRGACGLAKPGFVVEKAAIIPAGPAPAEDGSGVVDSWVRCFRSIAWFRACSILAQAQTGANSAWVLICACQQSGTAGLLSRVEADLMAGLHPLWVIFSAQFGPRRWRAGLPLLARMVDIVARGSMAPLDSTSKPALITPITHWTKSL